MERQPPKTALRFLRWFCRPDYLEEIEGNLIELFELQGEGDKSVARRRFYWNVLLHFRPEYIRPMAGNHLNQTDMFSNYLKFSLRFFWKNRFFSLVNLLGLSLGLAAALLIILNILNELSFDTHHERAERIARVHVEATLEGTSLKLATAPNQTAPFLKEKLPEVERATRVFPHNFGETASIGIEDRNYVEEHLFWADSNLFDVLTVPLILGDPATALMRANTVILSQTDARRYFGNDNPIGKSLRIDNRYDMEVTGVFEDPPVNTNLPFQMIGSFHTINMGKPEGLSWGNASFYNYLLLHPGVDLAKLEDKIAALTRENIPKDRQWFRFKVMPMLDVHLYSGEIDDEIQGQGDITQVWVLVALALVLLLIACINYMNLATARSEQKSKMVAINKTLGATSGQMVSQFFVETGLLTLLALILSVLLVWAALPFFNQIADRQLSITELFRPGFLAGISAGWLILTLLAGSYPALFLSAHRPLDLLNKNSRMRFGGLSVRKGLVVFQFCVSSVLIVCTMLLHQQLNFIGDKKLGYDPEQVIAVRVLGLPAGQDIKALERELQRLPTVVGAARSQSFPGHSTSAYGISQPNAPEAQGAELMACRAESGIIEVLDLELLAGRTLKTRAAEDTITQVIFNRSAVEFLGWTPEEAIGRRLEEDLGHLEIVGVVEDFHYNSLHKKIGFYAFHNRSDTYLNYLLLKVQTTDLRATLAEIQSTFESMAPATAFEYTFLDESLDQLYRAEQKLAKVVLIFAGLAILVALLGIFALTSFATERRIREIGIRKVLGATVMNIVSLLSKDFLKLTLIAFLLAIPIAWLIMNRWLQDFAYRIEIRWWVFAVAGGLALLITFLTTGLQSIRAATGNVVNSLKTE